MRRCAASTRQLPVSASCLVDYAVVLGMANGERLSGEPEKLLQRALELNPQHVQVLALLGSAALERHDRASALNAWKKVLALAPAGSGMARSIQASIARVEAEAAQ
jgi:cytochrome c-type biogenesis protein CcmH